MEPKLLNFWETGVCGDLTGGMWDWTTQEVTAHNTSFNIIYIMRTFVWSCRGVGWPDRKPDRSAIFAGAKITVAVGS
jgi:hypothetical protein